MANPDGCTTFTYGNYTLKPAPLFDSSVTMLKTPDGSGYGTIHNINFNGSILLTGVQERQSGIRGVFKEIDAFQDAFNRDGRLLLVTISGDPGDPVTGIFSGYPQLETYNISPRPSNDNYVFGADYSISMNMVSFRRPKKGDLYGDSFNNNTGDTREFQQHPPFIESMTENWDVEMDQDKAPVIYEADGGSGTEYTPFFATVNHTIDVQARLVYSGWDSSNDNVSKSDPFESARTWVTGLLYSKDGANARLLAQKKYAFLSGILRLDEVTKFSGADYTQMIKNHYRSVSTDRTNGKIQVKESYFIAPKPSSGAITNNDAREDWQMSTNFNNGVWNFNINGEIKGFDDNQYVEKDGFQWGVDGKDRWKGAKDYWAIVQPRLRDRLVILQKSNVVDTGQGDCASALGVIPQDPTQKTIGFNPAAGTISYDYTYEIFPNSLDCGAGYCIKSQQIRIEDTNATDVFASHVILGRSQGPLLQDIGTVTAKSRSISVELVVPPPTSIATSGYIYQNFPRDCVTALIDTLTGTISPAPDQIFITNNTESMGITDGNYTRQFAVTYTQCAP